MKTKLDPVQVARLEKIRSDAQTDPGLKRMADPIVDRILREHGNK